MLRFDPVPGVQLTCISVYWLDRILVFLVKSGSGYFGRRGSRCFRSARIRICKKVGSRSVLEKDQIRIRVSKKVGSEFGRSIKI